jgi:hypothetical protein
MNLLSRRPSPRAFGPRLEAGFRSFAVNGGTRAGGGADREVGPSVNQKRAPRRLAFRHTLPIYCTCVIAGGFQDQPDLCHPCHSGASSADGGFVFIS